MELVIGRKPGDKFCERIAQLTEEAKKNTQWRKQYMEWERQRKYDYEDGKEAGIAEGIAEGIQKKSVEDALMLIKDFKASPSIAAQKVNAPLELVLEALKQKK